MRGFKRSPWLTGLGVLLTILTVSANQARAEASIDKKASLLVFPKLVANSNTDTLVQITNTSTMSSTVHCTYVTTDCREFDFPIELTAQQPTFWRLSTGRFHTVPDPAIPGASGCTLKGNQWDGSCSCALIPVPNQPLAPPRLVCPEIFSGIFGNSPLPQVQDFDGAMYCYEIEGTDLVPIARNAIKGEAIIENLKSGDISAYNAIGVLGMSDGIGDVLDLNGEEFNSCPNWVVLNSYAEGFAEPAFGTSPYVNASVTTELSLVPCTQDLGNPGGSVAAQMITNNEFEQRNSKGINVGCVFRKTLTSIDPNLFAAWYQASETLATQIEGAGLVGGGLLGMGMETHEVSLPDGPNPWPKYVTAAFNLFHVYSGEGRQDFITTFPLTEVQPGGD